jgi:hypothetical protein
MPELLISFILSRKKKKEQKEKLASHASSRLLYLCCPFANSNYKSILEHGEYGSAA